MKTDFKLVGLSKPGSFTCHTPNGDIFWATSDMEKGRFKALFDYFKGEDWGGKNIVTIEHDGFYSDGTPVKPKIVDVKIN